LPPKGSCGPADSRAGLAGERLTDVLTNLSNDALVDAIDRNCVDFFQHYGRGPGCELHEEADLAWFVTGIPHPLFNGVMATDLAPERVDACIDEMVAEFRSRRIPLEWTTGSRTRPADLGHRLLTRGFEHTLDVPGMAMDLRVLPEEDPPRGFTVAQATNREDLEACVRIALSTFGIPEDFVPRLVEIEEGMPQDQKELTRHYLARLDGQPVATSELFLAAGVAGLYFVGTLPDARDRGIGRAVTLAALRGAREMGYRVGVLQATEMGTPVYRRLGFRALYSMGIYVRP
jgi:GNAT superfamily N-acetyltransferase